MFILKLFNTEPPMYVSKAMGNGMIYCSDKLEDAKSFDTAIKSQIFVEQINNARELKYKLYAEVIKRE